MLPHHHFAISSLATLPVAFALEPTGTATGIVSWAAIAGGVSALLDVDVLTLVSLRAGREEQLRPFRNPLLIFTRFAQFMDAMEATGLLRIAMFTHFVLATLVVMAGWFLTPDYYIPVGLAVVTHMLSDLPNVKRAFT